MKSNDRRVRTGWTEQERLSALDRYQILDTPREDEFEEVVALAAAICESPISVINLIADERQWFKAERGLGVRETPLDVSICAEAILQPDLFVVPDLTKDKRFDCNPLVVGEPRLRFYAGALLTSSDGLPLGTVCILDTKPRPEGLTEHQASALRILANQVMTQLELRIALRRQHEAETRYRAILSSAVDYGIISMDLDGMVETWNEGATRILGWSEGEMLDKPGDIFFTEEDREKGLPKEEMRRALQGEGALNERWHRRKDGSLFWGSGQMMLLKSDGDETATGFLKILRDRTEKRQNEEQRNLLAHELQHRVKNTLAMVSAIAAQTFRSTETKREAETAFTARLAALHQAYDILTRTNWTGAPISDVVAAALAPHRSKEDRFEISGPNLRLSPKRSLSLSLAVHELATNAAKYGALANDTGFVEISWSAGEIFRFTWREQDGPRVTPPTRRGFGTRLIERTLAGDFGGTVEITYPAGGVECVLETPQTDLGDD